MPQNFVRTPIFGQLYCRAAQIAVVLLQLRLKAGEERKSVGCGPGESGEDFVVVQPADLLGRVLDDAFAERDLAVRGHHHVAFATHADHCGRPDSVLSWS